MEQHEQKTHGIRDGALSAIPVIIGFFPVAMAFGLLAKTIHLSLLDSFLFSFLVFAGASQFMALDLIKAGVATGSIILSTFLLNLRHLMMSASLSLRLRGSKRAVLFFIAFGITDETFAVASLKHGKLTTPFLLVLQGLSYSAWVGGTVVGYIVGAILPTALQNSLGIGLYAMFAAILTPEMRKSMNVVILAVISAITYIVISYTSIIPEGWYLVATILIASVLGVFLIKEDQEALE